jgi:predicted MFS family arabinose efflux permease
MTTLPDPRTLAGVPGEPERLVSGPLMRRFVTIFGASASFYLLLSVAPFYVGQAAAGAATGSLMLATVAGELLTPWLTARFGYPAVLGAGLVLLGGPALVLTSSHAEGWIVVVCAVRGLGFAATVVAGGSITALLLPAGRKSEGLALVGIASGLPALVALPASVWLAHHVGYTPVSVAAGMAAIATIAVVPGLPGRPSGSEKPARLRGAIGQPSLMRPAAVFAATTIAAGIIVTFVPFALAGPSASLASIALFAQAAASMAARWVAGRVGDSIGPGTLITPGLVLAALGVLLMAGIPNSAMVISGVTLFGIGFGLTQNATLSVMYHRVPPSGYGVVSSLWNAAYDAGMGAGAAAFGLLLTGCGYRLGFALTGALMLGAAPLAWREHPRRTTSQAHEIRSPTETSQL